MKIKLISNINLLIILLISELIFFASPGKANPFFLGCWRWIGDDTTIRFDFNPDNTYTLKQGGIMKNGESFLLESTGTWQYDGVNLIAYGDENNTKSVFVISSQNTISFSFGNDHYTYNRC